jgi:hypothetical protein
MAKRTYTKDLDELVGVRIPIKHRNVLEARANERNTSLSEVLREIISVACEAMAETRTSSKPKVKHVIRSANRTETSADVVERNLRAKGLYQEPAPKRSPFRADGHHR